MAHIARGIALILLPPFCKAPLYWAKLNLMVLMWFPDRQKTYTAIAFN